MHAFEHASRATRGSRNYQEDMSAVWPGSGSDSPPDGASLRVEAGPLVAVLADGMGGHAGGALASRTVCEQFISTFSSDDSTTPTRLRLALDEANTAVSKKIVTDPALSGMGSTVVGVVFDESGVQWVSVGDSPLFLYRRGEIAVLNEDHSLAPELDRMAEAGLISEDAAKNDPRRHMLRSAVTGEDIDLIDQSKLPLKLEPGDYVILASDGLHTLESNEVARVVAAYADDGPCAVSDALIRAVEAVRDPHQDNATVVAVRPIA